MHSDKMCYMSVYVACFKSNHRSIVRILHLVCCVHGGLNGSAHAFLDCGCQVVELMVLVDLKHPQHPPSLPPLPPASPPGLTGGACDSLTCHLWQLAEEHIVLKDWSSQWMSHIQVNQVCWNYLFTCWSLCSVLPLGGTVIRGVD